MAQAFAEFCDYATDPENVKTFPRHIVELFIRLMEEGAAAPNKAKFMMDLEKRINRVTSDITCQMCEKSVPYDETEGVCKEHRFCQECSRLSDAIELGECFSCESD